MTYNQIVLIAYAGCMLVMSFVAFCMFCRDKSLAKRGQIRIQEKTLLGTCVLGGGIGSLIGRIIAHHKTDKGYFTFTIYLSVFLQIIVLVELIILAL